MLERLIRKVFGGRSDGRGSSGFFLKVRCSECGEEFNLFINKSTDINQDFDEKGGVSYVLNKEILGAQCRNVIRVTMGFDGAGALRSRRIEGGAFLE